MTNVQANPYLAARREWDERYGDQITRARNWRIASLLSSAGMLLAVAGLVWVASQQHFAPFIVAVDSLNRPVSAGYAGQVPVEERTRVTSIQTWIENVRLVTSDIDAQRKAIELVYSQIANATGATNLAEFCPAEPFASLAISGGYRSSGSCQDGALPLVKPVVADSGDIVEFSAGGMAVNGRLLPNSAPLTTDSKGRPLIPWPFGRYTVAPGTVWVASSYSPKSFDSRYFGPPSGHRPPRSHVFHAPRLGGKQSLGAGHVSGWGSFARADNWGNT
jgi:conjugative transfer signal peptidase TraF